MAELAADVERFARAVAEPADVLAGLGPASASTLSHGIPGTAVLLAALSAGDPALAALAERHWDTAAELLTGRSPDGIHSGPGALAASLVVGDAYLLRARHGLLDPAVAWLTARAQGLAVHQRRRRAAGGQGCPWGVYDTIKGLSGIGRILLAAERKGCRAAVPGLTAALDTLTHMINTPVEGRPGWWLPAQDHRLPVAGALPASGAATTGMAHGIAGPLALLSLAATAGHTVPGQQAAVRTAAEWLLLWADPDRGCPAHISGDALRRPPDPHHLATGPGRRTAWCYGAAGIGSAIMHAGTALDDPELHRRGHTMIAGIALQPVDRWDIDGPGLCHGSAGILQAARRAGCTEPAQQAARLTAHLLREIDDRPGAGLDIGFLGGTTGSVLALAEAAGLLPETEHTSWDALLLLS